MARRGGACIDYSLSCGRDRGGFLNATDSCAMRKARQRLRIEAEYGEHRRSLTTEQQLLGVHLRVVSGVAGISV